MNELTQTINFDEAMNFLNSASLHELYRLSCYIKNAMESPERIDALKAQLAIGEKIRYVEPNTNLTRHGVLLKKNPKYAQIHCTEDSRHWNIAYCMIEINSRPMTVNQGNKTGTLNCNNIKVGDILGFTYEGNDVAGQVERLNQKTVSLLSVDNRRWRVPYNALYHVIQGESRRRKNKPSPSIIENR